MSQQRTQKELLDRRRKKEADIRFRQYVAPEGATGKHLVREHGSSVVRLVSSVAGITFAPGSIVPTGSHTGFPGEFVIGAPPPGKSGASGFIFVETSSILQCSGISSIDPDEIPENSTTSIQIFGGGFSEFPLTNVVAVRLSVLTGLFEQDPNITVENLAFVSTSEMTADLVVGAVGVDYKISLKPG